MSLPLDRVMEPAASSKLCRSEPTVDIASVTRIIRSDALGGDGDAEARRGDVEEVDDQAGIEFGVVERRADHSGIASRKRRHCIKEVGDAVSPAPLAARISS